MIVSTDAVVLRRFDYQETSLIVEIFSKTNGLVSLIAKGARKNKRSLGVLEPLNIVFISYYCRTTKNLHFLSKYETISSFYKLLSSFERLVYGLMIAESISKTQLPESPNLKLYEVIVATLEKIKISESYPLPIFVDFMLFVIADLGFQLHLTKEKTNQSNSYKIPIDLGRGSIAKYNFDNNIFWLSVESFNLLSKENKIEIFSKRPFNIEIEKEIIRFFEVYLSLHLDKKFRFNSFALLI